MKYKETVHTLQEYNNYQDCVLRKLTYFSPVVVVAAVVVAAVGFGVVVIHVVEVESSKLWRAAIKTSKHNVLIIQNSGQTGAPMSSDSQRHTVSQTVQLAM